jgi:hypothetical protein
MPLTHDADNIDENAVALIGLQTVIFGSQVQQGLSSCNSGRGAWQYGRQIHRCLTVLIKQF